MIVDPLARCVAWWSDPAAGINAQLAGLPRAQGEAAPPDVTIFHELEHPWVARGEADLAALTGKRALCIAHFDPEAQGFPAAVIPEQAPETPAMVHIAAAYLTHGVVAPRALFDCRQTLRAAHRVIAQQFDDATTVHQERDTLLYLPTVRYLPTYGQLPGPPNVWTLGTLVVSFPVLDRWALGLT